MLYAIGFLIWIIASLIIMGAFCLICALIFALIPTKATHQMMWFFYSKWSVMLGWWVRKLVPELMVEHLAQLPEDKPFVLVANHYSWVDIIILYATIFTQERSFVFVMKRSLIKLPLIGVICWGVGHPLIHRGQARKKNLMILQDAAKRAKQYNYGVMIFPEGTRYTVAKDKPQSFNNLLTPRTVGFEKLLEAMQGEIAVIDVTLFYASEEHSVGDFLQGRLGKVKVISSVSVLSKETAQDWLQASWVKKDQQLQSMQLDSLNTD